MDAGDKHARMTYVRQPRVFQAGIHNVLEYYIAQTGTHLLDTRYGHAGITT
jgi:hypothetical protein